MRPDSSHDPDPKSFDVLAAHYPARYLPIDMRITERNVLAHLETASWVDVSHALDGSSARTAPPAGFTGTDFATMRYDYLLASQARAAHTRSHRMIRN